MNAIELMVNEHAYIKRMLAVTRTACKKIMDQEDVDFNDFYKIIDFVRNYADKHHHKKEEDMLFNKMVDELGNVGEKLVKLGMLVEHDLGRLYMADLNEAVDKVLEGNLEAKMDVIANALGYTYLLTRHIEKENEVAYKYAEKNLSKESLETLEKECTLYEEDAKAKGVQEKYIALLEELEDKYKK